jgi:hypothetical protein
MSGMLRFRPSPAMAVAFIALLASIGGVTYAAIPDGTGKINRCFTKIGGVVRVIDTEKAPPERCNATFEAPISWNQTGPPGAQGRRGRRDRPARPGPRAIRGRSARPARTRRAPSAPPCWSGSWAVRQA